MNRIKGIIFDLDGTLLLSMHVWDSVGSSYLRRQGVTPDPDTDDRIKNCTVEDACAYFRARYGLSASAEEIAADVNAALRHEYFDLLQPKPGVLAFLEGFRRAGVKMCVATATDRPLVEPAVKRCGIGKYMEAIFTCTEVGKGKDSPAIYRQAASLLGFPHEEIAVFEDAPYAAKTAKADGFFLVGVYDDSYWNRQEELRALADLYLPDYLSADPVKLLLGQKTQSG